MPAQVLEDEVRNKLLHFKRPSAIGRFEGHVDWKPDGHNLTAMRNFRRAVIRGRSQYVSAVFAALQSDSNGDQSSFLAKMVMNRSTAEPTKEALMTAICMGSRPMVEFILSLFYEFPGEERTGCRNSGAFAPHLTPLMLACHCNNYAITECLLRRNHSITLPHRPDCVCEGCKGLVRSHSKGIITLDTYRAISTGPFLWLACADPALAAFELSADLKICMNHNQEFRVMYEQLHRDVTFFSVSLVQHCWDLREVDVLLIQKDGAALNDCQLRFPRLRVALDCDMRSFVSTLSVQSAMHTHWLGAWPNYGRHWRSDLSHVLRHTVFFPFTALIHTISVGRYYPSYKHPYARYLSEMASYVLFLMLLAVVRLFGRFGSHSAYRAIDENLIKVILEVICYMYVFGLVVRDFLNFCTRGMAVIYRVWWTWFDSIILFLFSGSIFFALLTNETVKQDGLSVLHRKHWIPWDSSISYDIFFGCGCVMAFWRIFFYVQLNRVLGSLVISITRCVYDVVLFLIIMGVVMVCFAMGVYCVYESYADCKEEMPDGTVNPMKDFYTGLLQTWRNFYWAYYGYLAPNDYKVVVGNAGPNFTRMHHLFVQINGECLVAIYHLTVIITLLNLMVTLLVKRADEVQKNEEWEWKFMRAHIYCEYFDWYCTVPPPFNVLFIVLRIIHQFLKRKLVYAYPEVLVPQEILKMSKENALKEAAVYNNLLIDLFGRSVSAQEYHYRHSHRVDAVRCLTIVQGTMRIPNPIVTYMNGNEPEERD